MIGSMNPSSVMPKAPVAGQFEPVKGEEAARNTPQDTDFSNLLSFLEDTEATGLPGVGLPMPVLPAPVIEVPASSKTANDAESAALALQNAADETGNNLPETGDILPQVLLPGAHLIGGAVSADTAASPAQPQVQPQVQPQPLTDRTNGPVSLAEMKASPLIAAHVVGHQQGDANPVAEAGATTPAVPPQDKVLAQSPATSLPENRDTANTPRSQASANAPIVETPIIKLAESPAKQDVAQSFAPAPALPEGPGTSPTSTLVLPGAPESGQTATLRGLSSGVEQTLRQSAQVEQLVENLTQARDSGRQARGEMFIRHEDFGLVTLKLAQTDSGLGTALTSRDPAFALAAQQALSERPVLPAGDTQSGSRGADSGTNHQAAGHNGAHQGSGSGRDQAERRDGTTQPLIRTAEEDPASMHQRTTGTRGESRGLFA